MGAIGLADLTRYLDTYLRIAEVRDAAEAVNGLQVENASGTVSRLAVAVDACEATIAMAAEERADLLLVHHGLFWGGVRPLTGPRYRRIAALVRHDVAVYGAHLPLDCHPEVGNNAVLARQLGIAVRGGFGTWEGREIGVWGEADVSREVLARRITDSLGASPRLLAFGPPQVRSIGVVTGAGAAAIAQAAERGLDTLVTGEGPHWSYLEAEELRVNVLYAGHYATETVGVRALAAHLEARFGLPWSFLDHATGL